MRLGFGPTVCRFRAYRSATVTCARAAIPDRVSPRTTVMECRAGAGVGSAWRGASVPVAWRATLGPQHFRDGFQSDRLGLAAAMRAPTMNCWSRVALMARGANSRPPNRRHVPSMICRNPEADEVGNVELLTFRFPDSHCAMISRTLSGGVAAAAGFATAMVMGAAAMMAAAARLPWCGE